MNEPKRYRLYRHGFKPLQTANGLWPIDESLGEAPLCDYVRYEDYVMLKAKVERLTKAGDAMADFCGWSFTKPDASVRLVSEWNAAKEGKQP